MDWIQWMIGFSPIGVALVLGLWLGTLGFFLLFRAGRLAADAIAFGIFAAGVMLGLLLWPQIQRTGPEDQLVALLLAILVSWAITCAPGVIALQARGVPHVQGDRLAVGIVLVFLVGMVDPVILLFGARDNGIEASILAFALAIINGASMFYLSRHPQPRTSRKETSWQP